MKRREQKALLERSTASGRGQRREWAEQTGDSDSDWSSIRESGGPPPFYRCCHLVLTISFPPGPILAETHRSSVTGPISTFLMRSFFFSFFLPPPKLLRDHYHHTCFIYSAFWVPPWCFCSPFTTTTPPHTPQPSSSNIFTITSTPPPPPPSHPLPPRRSALFSHLVISMLLYRPR